MITVSTKRLMEAIEEAEEFSLPKMNTGTGYLYRNLYGRLTAGEEVTLSGLDFDAFELDDADEIRDIYTNTLERNERCSSNISRSLRGILPVTATPAFV